MVEDTKNNHVEYDFYAPLNTVTYTVKNKDNEVECSLSISDKGRVRLCAGKDNKEVACLYVHRDKGIKNIGGYEQYAYVEKTVAVKSIDGLLEVYKKIKDGKYAVYGNNADRKEEIGKLAIDFVDSYVFNTQESREVLHEYLNKEINKDKQFRDKSNALYLQRLNESGLNK